ncbi:MAG: tetratricopeptide repeat protein [Bacteroidota bacterium]
MFLAYVLDEKDKGKQAVDLYKEAEAFYKTAPDTLSLARLYINMAAVLMNLEDNENALKYLESAKILLNKRDSYFEKGVVYENIAHVNADFGFERKNLQNLFKALENYKKLEDKNHVAGVYAEMGVTYKNLNEYDSAMIYLNNAEQLAMDINNHYVLAQTLMNKGNLLDILGDNEDAKNCYKQSLEICKNHNIEYGVYLNYINMAEILIGTKEYKKANQLLQDALQICVDRGFGQKQVVYENLFIVSRAMNNFEDAVEYSQKIMDIKDSVYNAQLNSKVLEIQERYESEKMKTKLYKLQNREQRQELNKIYFIGIFVIVILILLFAIYFIFSKWRSDKQNAMLAIKEKEKANMQLESQKQELLSKSHYINKMEAFYNKLVNKIKKIQSKDRNDQKTWYNEIMRFIKINGNFNDTKNDFNKKLYDVNYKLVEALKNEYSDLTQAELKICIFLYLGMTTKEIADATNRSTRTVSNLRYRIRKKMHIDGQTELSGYIQQFASELS